MSKLFKWLLNIAGTILFGILVLNVWLVSKTEGQVFIGSIDEVPANEVGLVLGTSHRLQNGDSNMFFFQRIDQTVKLYKAGKIKHILVSGDNSSRYYNEPAKMKSVLVSKGIPEKAISMDPHGYRTLDSVIRSLKVYGNNKITIITQDFHSYRALFIANFYGLDAVASVGSKLPLNISIKIELREIFARLITFWDLYVMQTQPTNMEMN